MKRNKAEAEFFRYFEDVKIVDVKQETWERYIVPLDRYLKKEDYK